MSFKQVLVILKVDFKLERSVTIKAMQNGRAKDKIVRDIVLLPLKQNILFEKDVKNI